MLDLLCIPFGVCLRRSRSLMIPFTALLELYGDILQVLTVPGGGAAAPGAAGEGAQAAALATYPTMPYVITDPTQAYHLLASLQAAAPGAAAGGDATAAFSQLAMLPADYGAAYAYGAQAQQLQQPQQPQQQQQQQQHQ